VTKKSTPNLKSKHGHTSTSSALHHCQNKKSKLFRKASKSWDFNLNVANRLGLDKRCLSTRTSIKSFLRNNLNSRISLGKFCLSMFGPPGADPAKNQCSTTNRCLRKMKKIGREKSELWLSVSMMKKKSFKPESTPKAGTRLNI